VSPTRRCSHGQTPDVGQLYVVSKVTPPSAQQGNALVMHGLPVGRQYPESPPSGAPDPHRSLMTPASCWQLTSFALETSRWPSRVTAASERGCAPASVLGVDPDPQELSSVKSSMRMLRRLTTHRLDGRRRTPHLDTPTVSNTPRLGCTMSGSGPWLRMPDTAVQAGTDPRRRHRTASRTPTWRGSRKVAQSISGPRCKHSARRRRPHQRIGSMGQSAHAERRPACRRPRHRAMHRQQRWLSSHRTLPSSGRQP
jgi:hypothetical protein